MKYKREPCNDSGMNIVSVAIGFPKEKNTMIPWVVVKGVGTQQIIFCFLPLIA